MLREDFVDVSCARDPIHAHGTQLLLLFFDCFSQKSDLSNNNNNQFLFDPTYEIIISLLLLLFDPTYAIRISLLLLLFDPTYAIIISLLLLLLLFDPPYAIIIIII